MLTDIEKIIRDYLPEVVHMSLATSADNKPWICEVHYAYDNELNLYFVSEQSTRHSQEIEKNPSVAGNIVKQFANGEKVRGVYFEGVAEKLENVDANNPAFISYHERYGLPTDALEDFKKEGESRIYKIAVNMFYVFDKQESDGTKYELKWSK